jgi:hypothetical protein
MDVEHLWFSTKPNDKVQRPLKEPEPGLNEDNMVQTLTNMADKRLFKLVKWCKSLPLFKNILVIISGSIISACHTCAWGGGKWS